MALGDRIIAGDPDLDAVTLALLPEETFSKVTGRAKAEEFQAFVRANGGKMTADVFRAWQATLRG